MPEGLSLSLPLNVYLTVTKDPLLFIIGFGAICLAVLIEVTMSPYQHKLKVLAENSKQIQLLALICLASTVFSAWSVTSYSPNAGILFNILIAGRYAIIYPLTLFILALFLNPSFHLDFFSYDNLLKNAALFLLISSPLILYGLWRANISWTGIISLTFLTLVMGLVLIYRGLSQRS